jgi:hypothetical protein
MASIIQGDCHYTGNLSAASMSIPSNAIGDSQVKTGSPIDAAKLQHQYNINKALFAHSTTVAVTRQVIHVGYGSTGTIIAFGVGCTVAPTTTDTVVLTLKKNGVSILSGSITLDSGNTNFVIEAGTVTDTVIAAGNVFEVDVTVVTGTSAKGLFAQLVVREQPSP